MVAAGCASPREGGGASAAAASALSALSLVMPPLVWRLGPEGFSRGGFLLLAALHFSLPSTLPAVGCFASGVVAAAVSVVVGPSVGAEADVPFQVFLDGEPLPEDEGASMGKLTAWMDRLQWSPEWPAGGKQQALALLNGLVPMAPKAPWLALGLGQVFLLYFWWRQEETREVDVDIGRLALEMHRLSIRATGCDAETLPNSAFMALQCAWRWRHVAMISAELGAYLAQRHGDLALAAAFLRDSDTTFAAMRRLPFFAHHTEWPASPHLINSNAEFFPGPVNRPVWPSESMTFARFLEDHFSVFRADLDRLLQEGLYSSLYWSNEISMTQFAPSNDGWMILGLIKNQKLVDRVCEFVPASCQLLASRPELAECGAADAGAAFASMKPGSGLRPHFWNTPRLGAHMGLRTTSGSTMYVGTERVMHEEGQVIIFDDTYPHSATHDGTEPRYVLVTWICHPCDSRLNGVWPPERPEPLCPTPAATATNA